MYKGENLRAYYIGARGLTSMAVHEFSVESTNKNFTKLMAHIEYEKRCFVDWMVYSQVRVDKKQVKKDAQAIWDKYRNG